VLLRVSDPVGQTHEVSKTVTLDPALLSVLALDQAKVYFDPGDPHVKLKGEIGLPSGVDYSELAAVVAVQLDVAGPFLPATPVAFTVKGGGLEKWQFRDPGVLGITKLDIDWDGGRFQHKSGPIELKSQILTSNESVLSFKYKFKDIGAAFTIDLDGQATVDVDANGDLTASVPFEVEKAGNEVTLTLPFALLDASLITFFGGVNETIVVGDDLKVSVGRFRLDVDYDAAVFPDGVLTTPRDLELTFLVGTQGYANTVALDENDLEIKGNKWEAKP
jgi:hypothetical protein